MLCKHNFNRGFYRSNRFLRLQLTTYPAKPHTLALCWYEICGVWGSDPISSRVFVNCNFLDANIRKHSASSLIRLARNFGCRQERKRSFSHCLSHCTTRYGRNHCCHCRGWACRTLSRDLPRPAGCQGKLVEVDDQKPYIYT
jgi:hypothetical protein